MTESRDYVGRASSSGISPGTGPVSGSGSEGCREESQKRTHNTRDTRKKARILGPSEELAKEMVWMQKNEQDAKRKEEEQDA
jgi:hypothetical protein